MNDVNQDLQFWLALLHAPKIGPIKFLELSNKITPREVFSLSIPELSRLNLHPQTLTYLRNPDWHLIERDLDWLAASNQHFILSFNHPNYPLLLKEIMAPPPVLFVKGDVNCLNKPQIAIVGSRNPTPMGRETARQFAKQLALDFGITSGLAIGIDAAAHAGALEVQKLTIGILGTGLNKIYPSSHQALADQIVAAGALVSEFPTLTSPRKENFPRRNRIISGLSLGTLVVEANAHSGSLITARYAVEQGREVFAIPGSIHHPLSRGSHLLIRQGAKLVETVDDIYEELLPSRYGISSLSPSCPSQNMLDEDHRKLLECIGYEPTQVERLIEISGLSIQILTNQLLELETKGFIIYTLGGYSRISNERRYV